ncbi:hypothetical protein EYZ11_010683 [Aspergillus tanneri]|uniref:Uncharacterized protein n=1 Tax=Aspergillus tanneri TaxID=1220188 RepID=A0A4V3UN57_9EURO|nr:hypothetical protein EYZ11_010683 [Aspergillus tanneri]
MPQGILRCEIGMCSWRPGVAKTVTQLLSKNHPDQTSTPLTSTRTSVANDQYLLAQQPYYPHSSTPTHEFYPPQNIPMTPVAVQEAPPIVAHNVPVTPPVDVQHVQQQYMQQLMQQRYDQGRPGYVPPEFQHPFGGVPTADGHGLMVTYPQNFQYKQQQQTRLLNQPEGTDWAFLGVPPSRFCLGWLFLLLGQYGLISPLKG